MLFSKKTTQSEMGNDNEETFNHEFSKKNAVDYIALVEKDRVQSKNLTVKRKYQILSKRNKRLQIFFRNNEINMSIRCRRSAILTNDDFSIKFLNLNINVQSLN